MVGDFDLIFDAAMNAAPTSRRRLSEQEKNGTQGNFHRLGAAETRL
jgi:hypothetical protein